MNFLTVSPYVRGHGAYERQRRMARALVGAGHSVTWLSPGMDNPDGIRVIEPGESRLPGPLGWIDRVRKGAAAAGLVDRVFTISEYDALGCLMASNLAQLAHVFFSRGDTVLLEKFHAEYATKLSRRIKSRFLGGYYPIMQRYILGRMKKVVVQAPFLADIITLRCPNLRTPLEILPNDCRFDWHPETPPADIVGTLRAFKRDRIMAGLVAQTFWAGKGFDLFFQAMERLRGHPGFCAIIIGYGADDNLIRRTIADRHLSDQVLFAGRIGAAHQFMSELDFLVAPTRFMDACPNVIMEAMETATPILASDIPAHQAQLKHRELLFASGDVGALAEGIERLLQSSARDRNRQLLLERRHLFDFDWDARVVKILTGEL